MKRTYYAVGPYYLSLTHNTAANSSRVEGFTIEALDLNDVQNARYVPGEPMRILVLRELKAVTNSLRRVKNFDVEFKIEQSMLRADTLVNIHARNLCRYISSFIQLVIREAHG
jgi:hypothetical protein